MGAVKNHWHDELEAARALEDGHLADLIDARATLSGVTAWLDLLRRQVPFAAEHVEKQLSEIEELLARPLFPETTRDSGAANNPPEVNQ